MGMDLTVQLPGEAPSWNDVRQRLALRGLAVQMRMIDGQLAFPDEDPPREWHELRVAASGGMVTVRRSAAQVVCTVWGNADEPTRRLWESLARAFADAGGGQVMSGGP